MELQEGSPAHQPGCLQSPAAQQWCGGTVRLGSTRAACTKSINAAIRCQQLMTAPSTPALGMAPPKPAPAPLGSATTAAHTPCSPPTITDGLPSTPPGGAFPHHPFVCAHCEQQAANHPCPASCRLSRQDGFVSVPLSPAACVKPCCCTGCGG